MAALNSLLNPAPEVKGEDIILSTIKTSSALMEQLTPRKKVKLTKDAAVFNPGPVRGECRFPPDEFQDEELASYHQQFEVTPFGEIADYPRHIPYNSDKKAFLEKTHREYLEVFQYTFKVPGDDHIYTMLWDYNIGLVRTTALFKSTGHSKTTPAKMLSRNPGLREICHSITGGALVAQGYWMPHAAAKAVAATFCFDIRHALTPVFGHDFPNICIKPDDERFGDMTIDPVITDYCGEQARRFRDESAAVVPLSTSSSSSGLRPTIPMPRRPKGIRSKRLKDTESTHTSPLNSPYASEITSDDGNSSPVTPYLTPKSSPAPTLELLYTNVFTPMNTPRSTPRSVPFPERKLPSPRDMFTQSPHHYRVKAEPSPTPSSTGRCSSTEVSPKTIPARLTTIGTEFSQRNTISSDCRDLEWLSSLIRPEDEHAAYVLLGLKLGKSPGDAAHGLGISLGDDKEKRTTSA